jgi:hypothetical protein
MIDTREDYMLHLDNTEQQNRRGLGIDGNDNFKVLTD